LKLSPTSSIDRIIVGLCAKI